MKLPFIKALRASSCEVFKSLNNAYPEFMWSYFILKSITYNIRNGPLLRLADAKLTYSGLNLVLFRSCILWNDLPLVVDFGIKKKKKKMKDLRNNKLRQSIQEWTKYCLPKMVPDPFLSTLPQLFLCFMTMKQ